jgi:sensor domain CHASE-containing protein/nitrogen-specific signal transduction histidine kinase
VSIRSKVTALIAGIFVILGLASILVGKFVVMPSFAELERADARTAMRRIDHALERAQAEVATLAMDWGNWAETYRFMDDRNPAYVTTNISNAALKQVNVNALLIVDRAGQVVLGRDVDLTNEQPLGLDFTQLKTLPDGFPWRAASLAGTVWGLLPTEQGILLLGAAPVLDGKGHGPARGMVVMGRLLTPDLAAVLAAQAQSDLALLPPSASPMPERIEETTDLTRVFRSLADIYGHPIATLRVNVPRAVTQRGWHAVELAAVTLCAAAVLVLILLVVVLNRVVLDPLSRVTQHAVTVGEGRDLTTRLELARRDEIGILAQELDRMVERMAESRTRLVDQSFQAGFAELAKGVLHNLGNAMTPISVRLANMDERLRLAGAEDAEQAVAELQAGVADPQRRTDLEEFLRLACRELAATVQGAQQDVALMSRQTSLIQSTLSEQMSSAHNEHVIEPVRLTDLVAQSLEIVPDACRQRLQVQPDETLRRLGVVHVARTVLRLILQNLIINAADAVRDAGKERGTLRLSAEILAAAEGTQLHLKCQDDGVGIPPQNLERVFEKGFSTKSPETNHGIGLHWCANAIGALGGRIWAVSDGPGRGAALHLLVPLMARLPASLAGAA